MSFISDYKSSPISLFGVNGLNSSTDSSLSTIVGVRFSASDAREFVLVQNGASALASGVLVAGPATIGANHIGLAVVSAVATGGTSITVTNGGTATTANQYAGGFATISAGTGAGQNLRIASNTASGTSGNTVLTLEDPLSVNLSTSTSKVTLTLNQYGSGNGTDVRTHGVVISPSGSATSQTIGVTVGPIGASSATVPTYGFIQTKGAVACLSAGGGTAGLGVMRGAVNGAVSTLVVATQGQVGTNIVTAEDGKNQLISINL